MAHTVENRKSRRFALALPVAVKAGAREDAGTTRDVNANSAFFYTDAAPEVGSELDFTVSLPRELTRTESLLVHCKGRVVRVDEKDGRIGVAAVIRQYDLVQQI